MIHRVGRRTDPIYSSAPADCKRYLNGYGMISRITGAVLEEIDAVRSASSTRGSVDVTLLELLVEWEILGEEAGLHEMIMWANAFLFNRLLRLSVAENSLIVVLN